MIKSKIHSLIHSGIPKNANYQELEAGRLLNISSLFLASMYIGFSIILTPFVADFYFSSMGLFIGAGFLLPFFLQRVGLHLSAKITYLLYHNISTFVASSSLGAGFDLQIAFLLHLSTSFIFFTSKRYVLRLIAVNIPVFLFCLLTYYNYDILPRILVSPELEIVCHSIVWFALGGFFIMISYNSLLLRELVTKDLNSKNNELGVEENRLKDRNTKLKIFTNDLDRLWNKFQEIENTLQNKDKTENLYPKNIAYDSEEEKLEAVILKLRLIQEKMQLSYKDQQQFVAMVENSFDFIALADFKGTLLYINEEGRKMIGLEEDKKLKNLKMVDLMQKETGNMVYREVLPEIVKRGFWKGELDLIHFKTGEIIYTDVSTFIIRDKKTQEPLAWTTIQKDITKRKRTEEKLHNTHENLKKVLESERESREDLAKAHEKLKNTQSQLVFSEKMASLGQLTAGIAHEINNPMNFVYAGGDALRASIEELIEVVNLYSTLDDNKNIDNKLNKIKKLKEKLEYSILIEDIRTLLDDVRVGAERTIQIVKSLKLFSHSDDEEMKQTDIHRALDATLVILKGIAADGVKITKNYDSSLKQINCLSGQMGQVFMNIIGNAFHAIEEKEEGIIEITTENFIDKITISIRDNGRGMTEKTQKRIFEPFFTTKEVGKGTGLGMSISYGIIEKHRGSIEIKSKEDEGSEFIITLPKKK